MNRCLVFLCLLLAFLVVATTPKSFARIRPAGAAEIYSARCAKCHGADGSGVEKYKKKGVKDFTAANWQQSRSDAQILKSITDGKGDVMPAWKAKLSADEIRSLVAFVRSLKK